MPISIGELSHDLRIRVLKTDPVIWAQYQEDTAKVNTDLAVSCELSEQYMLEHGENEKLRRAVDMSRAFIRGEITPEELNRSTEELLQ